MKTPKKHKAAVSAPAGPETTKAGAIKSKKGCSGSGGVEQFDPNLDLANLFSGTATSSTIAQHGKPAFPPMISQLPTKPQHGKKDAKLTKRGNDTAIRPGAGANTKKKSNNLDPVEGVEEGTSKKKPKLSKISKHPKANPKKKSRNDVENTEDDVANNEQEDEEKGETKPKPQRSFSELNAPKPKNEEWESRTVFVGNVPKQLIGKKNDLKQLFQPWGTIESIRFRGITASKPTILKKVALYRNKIHSDRSNVNAYIRFSTCDEAERAVEQVNGTKIHEHHLNVDLANNSLVKKDRKKAIFIGNLSLNSKEDDLWSLFEDCGKIKNIRIVRDQKFGIGKGFGYINFESTDSIQLALTKNEQDLNGRPLRVTRVVKKLKKKKVKEGTGNPVPPSAWKNGKRTSNPTSSTMKSRTSKASSHSISRNDYAGDKTSEVGKLKGNSRKLNLGELKKARIVKQLLGNSARTTSSKPFPRAGKSVPHSEKNVSSKPKQSNARKLHSKARANQFKNKKQQPKTGKVSTEKASFKRYFSK